MLGQDVNRGGGGSVRSPEVGASHGGAPSEHQVAIVDTVVVIVPCAEDWHARLSQRSIARLRALRRIRGSHLGERRGGVAAGAAGAVVVDCIATPDERRRLEAQDGLPQRLRVVVLVARAEEDAHGGGGGEGEGVWMGM